MPGLSVLFDFHGNALKRKADFIRSMDSALPDEQYRREDLFHDSALLLGCTRYENYPAVAFHGELFSIYLEGRVYGKNLKTLESELTLLAETLFRDRSRGKEKLLKWLLDADGEFIAFIRKRDTGEIILFNDLLGHLPLYCYGNGDFFLISREIGIFQTFLSGIQLDRMAVAQYLLFAFSLGSRTLIENVRRVKRASLFYWAPGSREVIVGTLHEMNYDFEEHAGRSLGSNIGNLIELLGSACRDRANYGDMEENVVSLSGGLDSRAVAGGLKRSGIPFQAITYMDYRKTAQRDLELAEQVARLLHAPWTRVDLDPPLGKSAYRLLGQKHGLNYLSMRFIIPYFELILARYGPGVSYFSGNTGMSIRSYTPDGTLRSVEHAVNSLFSRGGKFIFVPLFSFEEAAAITGMNKKDIFQGILDEVASYPEHTADRKYMHFMFSGYCFNWHYEGIDMQRGFLWQSIPLESTPFFLYAVGCPDKQKMHYHLYREFINVLTPETAIVNNATWNSPVNSPKTVLNFIVRSYYNRLPSSIKGTVRRLFRDIPRYEEQSPVVQCIRKQMESCREIADYFSPTAVESAIKTASKLEIDALLTLTSLIEEIFSKQSTLREYHEVVFE